MLSPFRFKVRRMEAQPAMQSRIASGPCKLFFGQLRGDIVANRIYELLAAANLVHSGVRVVLTHGRLTGALVRFARTEDADAVILALHHSTSEDWVPAARSRKLQVCYSKYSDCVSLLGYVHGVKLHHACGSNPLPRIMWNPACIVWHQRLLPSPLPVDLATP